MSRQISASGSSSHWWRWLARLESRRAVLVFSLVWCLGECVSASVFFFIARPTRKASESKSLSRSPQASQPRSLHVVVGALLLLFYQTSWRLSVGEPLPLHEFARSACCSNENVQLLRNQNGVLHLFCRSNEPNTPTNQNTREQPLFGWQFGAVVVATSVKR